MFLPSVFIVSFFCVVQPVFFLDGKEFRLYAEAAGKGAVSEKENKTALRMDLTLQEQSFSVGQLCRSAPYQWNL